MELNIKSCCKITNNISLEYAIRNISGRKVQFSYPLITTVHVLMLTWSLFFTTIDTQSLAVLNSHYFRSLSGRKKIDRVPKF